MATVKRPRINLHIPFRKENRCICIEYPGNVKNPKKMIQTLGGLKMIENALNTDSDLSLRFRPKDPTSNPIKGTARDETNLVLRIKKYRNKKTGEIRYFADISRVISTTYEFKQLADFQSVPAKTDPNNKCLKSVEKSVDFNQLLRNSQRAKDVNDMLDKDAPLHTPPFFMSKGRVGQYNYKDIAAQLGHNKPHNPINYSFYIKDTDEIPTAKREETELVKKYVGNNLEKYIAAAEKVLSARPVISRPAFNVLIEGIPQHHIDFVLPFCAFRYETGHFRSFWVKYGYDPSKHQECHQYQLCDFRVRNKRLTLGVPINQKSEQVAQNAKKNKKVGRVSYRKYKKPKPTANTYVFSEGALPPHRQMLYQICDIKLKEVEEVVQSSRLESFDRSGDGWFKKGTLVKIRTILDKDIQKVAAIKYANQMKNLCEDDDAESDDEDDDYDVIDDENNEYEDEMDQSFDFINDFEEDSDTNENEEGFDHNITDEASKLVDKVTRQQS